MPTIAELDRMTDDAISELVALRIMGWRRDVYWFDREGKHRNSCFATDANAVREVEAALDAMDKTGERYLAEQYIRYLVAVACGPQVDAHELSAEEVFDVVRATTRQRCIAALMCVQNQEQR